MLNLIGKMDGIQSTISNMSIRDTSPARTAIGSIFFITTAGMLIAAIRDYRGWLALGAGGLPYNLFGWVVQWYCKLRMARETMNLECYTKPLPESISDKEKARNDASYLTASLPTRQGQRRRAAHWVIPQRQLGNQKPSQAISAVSLIRTLSSYLRSHSLTCIRVQRHAHIHSKI